MKTELIKTIDAVGKVLFHDVTRIEKDAFKGAAFKKGHVIKEEDISVLLSMGKDNIYSIILEEGDVHEDEAGKRLASALAGKHIELRGPAEGRVNLVAGRDGLLKINKEAVYKLNLLPDVVVATLHDNFQVKGNNVVCGAKVVPLVVQEKTVREAEAICKEYSPVVDIESFTRHHMTVVITGKEVYEGNIEDAFGPVMKEKAEEFGLPEPSIKYVPDDPVAIAHTINSAIADKASMVVVTGGMSVDPDDVTPVGIKKSGAHIEKYGAPVLPGAMFLLAYKKEVPVVGVPACGMFFNITIFDLILPRLLSGEKVTAEEIASLGYGGLCCRCESCRFPYCSFGKK